jgi:hypothetical protein
MSLYPSASFYPRQNLRPLWSIMYASVLEVQKKSVQNNYQDLLALPYII